MTCGGGLGNADETPAGGSKSYDGGSSHERKRRQAEARDSGGAGGAGRRRGRGKRRVVSGQRPSGVDRDGSRVNSLLDPDVMPIQTGRVAQVDRAPAF